MRRSINIPVVTGKAHYTKSGFRQVFEKGAADIINPDICNAGGLLELIEVAAMAEPYYVAVSPHGWNSTTVGLAASLQVAARAPNFIIMEYPVSLESLGDDIAVNPLKVEHGYIVLSTGPGLGIEMDEEALTRFHYQELPQRPIREYVD